MNRAFAFIALAGLAVAPIRSSAQELRGELKGGTLAVKVQALVPKAAGAQDDAAGWQEESVKYTVTGVPVGVKLLGSNLIIMTQVTPFDRGDGKLTLVAQGQVWIRSERGSISYRSTIQTVTVSLGETVLFYPLGVNAEGKAPLRIELSVSRRAGERDAPEQPASGQGVARDQSLPAPPPPAPEPAAQGPDQAKPKR